MPAALAAEVAGMRMRVAGRVSGTDCRPSRARPVLSHGDLLVSDRNLYENGGENVLALIRQLAHRGVV